MDLFCCDGEDRKYFDHDFHNYVRHSRGPRNSNIDLQSPKNVFYALEKAQEKVSTTANGASGLICQNITIARERESVEILTERRTPMPVKITPAGGYVSRIKIRLQILGELP
jgi:hypothetical protein